MTLMKTKTALTAGLAALTLGAGLLMSSAPAEARPWGYGHRGFHHGGFYRPVVHGPRFYRPAFYGGYYRPYYRRPHGGALAAGLIGGLAVGALAASAAHAAPYYAVAPAYDGYGPACTITKTRFVDDWGRVVIRKTKVCN